MTPTIFVNVFTTEGQTSAGGEVLSTRAEAIRYAEEFAGDYQFTLTDAGKIDLSDEFSERYQAQRAYDAKTDARIDHLKAARAS